MYFYAKKYYKNLLRFLVDMKKNITFVAIIV